MLKEETATPQSQRELLQACVCVCVCVYVCVCVCVHVHVCVCMCMCCVCLCSGYMRRWGGEEEV